jgi:hypothetical protein
VLESLDQPPRLSDTFFWTDFIELRAIAHPDKCFSRGDLSSLERRSRDTGVSFDVEKKWREVVNFAAQRSSEFGAGYPFSISSDEDTVEYNEDEDTARRTYLGLLVASSMRLIANERRQEVARDFEESCFLVFKQLMPEGAVVRSTWAGGGASATYRGTLFEKMKSIAADIRCTANFQDRDFKNTDSGDGGIDLISWHPMTDSRSGMPIAFAQCGCSKEDWKFKQSEASFDRHGTRLPVMHPWATYYFMPLDLRHSDGGWAYESDIGKAIIVDRLRLMRLASQYKLHDQLPPMVFVDDVVSSGYR